jgi:hypothetical protein
MKSVFVLVEPTKKITDGIPISRMDTPNAYIGTLGGYILGWIHCGTLGGYILGWMPRIFLMDLLSVFLDPPSKSAFLRRIF